MSLSKSLFSILLSTALIASIISCNGPSTSALSTEAAKDSTGFDANLYLQSAAEFAMLCRQAYENAGHAVMDLAKEPRGEKPFAVVMDLDETVVDNSAYQNHLFNKRQEYKSETWDAFVKDAATKDSLITLVPGVYEFINLCKSQNIEVVFISNRMNSTRKETAITLAKLGIDTSGLGSNDSKRMLLQTDTRNKDMRRDTVKKYFDPRIYIGDNISDFTSDLEDRNQVERRKVMLSGYADRIGKTWFLIPNPTYGDWVKNVKLRNSEYTVPIE